MSTTHLLILLAVVVLIFGTKKISSLGSDLGSAVKGFKDGMKGETDKPAEQPSAPVQQVTAAHASSAKDTIDVEAKTKF